MDGGVVLFSLTNLNDRLIDLTISGQKVKNEEDVMRVKIRPVRLKDEIKYQASEFVGRKVLHTNYSEEDIKTRITEYMENTFKQAQFNMTDARSEERLVGKEC